MSDTTIMVDLIFGIHGAWVGYCSNRSSESNMVRPLYRPTNGFPTDRKYPIEIPEELIITVDLPGDYKGQFTQVKFIIPSRDLKDVNFESTPFFKVFGAIDSRVNDLSKQKKLLERDLHFAEKRLKDAGIIRDQKSQAQGGGSTTCTKCGKSMTNSELEDSGGFCTTPNCGEVLKAVAKRRF